MVQQNSADLAKIRQQFDFHPYAKLPIEFSPQNDPKDLYQHSITTAYYIRNKKVINSEDKIILDAGCGAGYTSLVLAEANPSARVIGIDLSEKSIELARQRIEYHNLSDRVEFQVLSITDIASLNLKFDYIDCDEVLYLMPDVIETLKIMKAALKPEGIIRTNLHSSLQRFVCYRAQELFGMMGLMDNNPEDMEIDIATEILNSLQDDVILRRLVGSAKNTQSILDDRESILMNYLLLGDKGYTIPDVFRMLEAAELELINMVNYRQWQVQSLFKEPDNLPVFLSLALPEATLEERLHIFELLHPVHRLIDFWCGHVGESHDYTPVAEWSDEKWRSTRIYLHPQLQTPQVKAQLQQCCQQSQPFAISQLLPIDGVPAISLESTLAATLIFPLLEAPQFLSALVERWLKLRPLDLETLEPTQPETVFTQLQTLVTRLENLGFILLD